MSQCDAILAVLKDGEWHTIDEIHRIVGPCRLNSRVAELRDPEKRWRRNVVCHREDRRPRFGHGRPEVIYRYKDFGPLESGVREGAAPDSSAGVDDLVVTGSASQSGEPSEAFTFPRDSRAPALVGPSLDEYGVERAAAEVNDEFPGMLLEDGVPVSERLPIEASRAELAKLQQTLWGRAA